MRPRTWGYWSQAKLQILQRYLPAFLQASSNIRRDRDGVLQAVYIDAFAGLGRGIDRLTGQEFNGSARIAAEARAANDHHFSQLIYFELADRAAELEQQLRTDYPGRNITVYPGDCNDTIPIALGHLRGLRWAPTFAFLDPDGLELAWDTLRALAAHKHGYRGAASTKPEYKVELWILFSSQGLIRTLALDAMKLRPGDEARATRLFGTRQWLAIYERRRAGELDPADARAEYVNLMRWLLQTELGYVWTHSLELKNEQGGTVYHMIFATDNAAGNSIMGDLYRRAATEIPLMAREAHDGRRGQLAMDVGGFVEYVYEEPWAPPGGETDAGRPG